jgi:thioredoxin reductase (NADPH)
MTTTRKADCLVVGAGPAGLLAAVYLARFRREVTLIDGGQSRCSLIPRSNNVPGFEDGVSGNELLGRMREQAGRFDIMIEKTCVERLDRTAYGFSARCKSGEVVDASAVILATGIVDCHPDISGWRTALAQGDLRYCPICDGYEAIKRSIAVIGSVQKVVRRALFVRTYSDNVSALKIDADETWSDEEQRLLERAGVRMHTAHVIRLDKRGELLTAIMSDGREFPFDVVYPAMGAHVRSELATTIGADHDEAGFLKVNGSQETTVKGLYAIGDVVSDLHQISVAFGHAAVAACSVHNCLPGNPI